MYDYFKGNQKEFNLDEFRKIVEPSSLSNTQLLYLMDDSLSINAKDLLKFLQSQGYIVKNHDHLVEIVGQSPLHHFDEKSGQVKLKKKCERRIIVFPNYEPKIKDNQQVEIKEIFTKIGCSDKIVEIEKLQSGIIFVYFENEEETASTYKLLEKYKLEHNLDLSANIKAENLKSRLFDKLEEPIHHPNISQRQHTNSVFTKSQTKEDDLPEKKRAHTIIESNTKNKGELKGNYQISKNLISNRKSQYNKKQPQISNKFDVPVVIEKQPNFQPKNENHYNKNYHTHNASRKQGKAQSFKIPLNKDYDINLDETYDSQPAIPKHKPIEVKYNFMEFAKIFFNLNLLKKNEKPERYQNQYISEVMRLDPRTELDVYRNRNLERKRAQTHIEPKRSTSSYPKRPTVTNKQAPNKKRSETVRQRNSLTIIN